MAPPAPPNGDEKADPVPVLEKLEVLAKLNPPEGVPPKEGVAEPKVLLAPLPIPKEGVALVLPKAGVELPKVLCVC